MEKFPLIRLMRPHHWIKNLAVLFPLVLSEPGGLPPILRLGVMAFLLFSGAASAVYIFNDLLDAARDREHSLKAMRPLVAKEVSPASALTLLTLLLLAVFGASWELNLLVPMALYIAGNAFYSLLGKKLFLIDIGLIALFFLLRVQLGSMVFGIPLPSLFVFVVLIYFFGLAALKRYVEISSAEKIHRPYQKKHRFLMAALSCASIITALALFSFFLWSDDLRVVYHHSHWLFLLPIVIAAGNVRLFQKARRQQLPEDLSTFLIRDAVSWGLLGACLVSLHLAR